MLLADRLLQRLAGTDIVPTLTQAAASALLGYTFPGNVRELRNILERASLLCDGDTLQVRHLPEELQSPPSSGKPDLSPANAPSADAPADGVRETLDDAALALALQTHKGSRKALAIKLGMSERTLYRRLKDIA